MTEAEWLASVNSQAMLKAVRSKGSERLWRLFAVACVRRLAHRMRYDASRQALDVAERFADGIATREELRAARAQAETAARQAHLDQWQDEVRANFCWDEAHGQTWAAQAAADAAVVCVAEAVDANTVPEGLLLSDVIREVFGNPFRWTLIDPDWLSLNDGAARNLAQTIYDRRAFELLPVLADALEDAGCADEAILSHLRSAGPHLRGCWALDLILSKE